MHSEIWKDIVGYEGHYQVSNYGRIKSIKIYRTPSYKSRRGKKDKVLKLNIGSNGYAKVYLYKDGERKSYKVHRLVAEAFIPNPDNKNEVNHLDKERANNKISNLEWCTSSENAQHRVNFNKK